MSEEKDTAVFPLNQILYGPPGTGKTYNTVNYAVAICDGKSLKEVRGSEEVPIKPFSELKDGEVDASKQSKYEQALKRYDELKEEGRIAFITFHQSYSYEEFIEGIKPKLNGSDDTLNYVLEDGVFKKFCNKASNDSSNPYVFIIDEINRGNISKIFGELITLIEESKRKGNSEAAEAILPYSGKTFSVPNNVYILGTMNTADRSIALMDTALRRRFSFVEMMPDTEVLNDYGIGTIVDDKGVELDVIKMLKVINERISVLYDREHTIGHAYFMKLIKDASIEELGEIFRTNIIPLLQEYFYEDYEKIQLVLGDNAKSEDQYKFIKDEKIESNLFKRDTDLDLPDRKYIVNEEALKHIESYIGIYADISKQSNKE